MDALIRRRLVVGTLSNASGRALVLVVWFLLTPFILGRIGPVEFGLWVLVASIVSYGSLLDLGMGSAVIKYVAEFRARDEWESARSLVATAIRLYALLGLVAVGLGMALAPVVGTLFRLPPEGRDRATWLVILMALNVGLGIAFTPSSTVLRGLQRFDLHNVVTTIGSLLVAMATVAVLLAGGGLLAMVAVNVPVLIVMQLVQVSFIRRVAPELRYGAGPAEWAMARRLARYGSSLFVVHVSGLLQKKTDEIVIAAFIVIAAVTPYSLARRLSEVAHQVTEQFVKVLLPLASELVAVEDRARVRELFVVASRITLGLLLAVGLPIIFLAAPILGAWVGPVYAGASDITVILTISVVVATAHWPAVSILMGMGRNRPLAWASLAAGLANLGLSVVLVGPLGAVGVALGTLVPAIVENIGFVLPFTLRTLDLRPKAVVWAVVAPAVVAALPAAILLAVGRQFLDGSLIPLLALIASAIALYGLTYLALPATSEERSLLRELTALRRASAATVAADHRADGGRP